MLDIVRSGVAIANKLTADVQADVMHESFLGQTVKGDRQYSAPVSRPAIVQMKQKSVLTASGELTMSNAQIVILDPTVVITDDDRFTLPDGTTQPIIRRAGFVDRGTGLPILTEIFLG